MDLAESEISWYVTKKLLYDLYVDEWFDYNKVCMHASQNVFMEIYSPDYSLSSIEDMIEKEIWDD